MSLSNTPQEHGAFFLDLLKVDLVANQQKVHMPFTSTGFPNVTYEMYYKPLGQNNYLPVTSSVCLEHSGAQSDVSQCTYCMCVMS